MIEPLGDRRWMLLVYRGGSFIDGLAILEADEGELGRAITGTKYFAELRVLIVDDERVDAKALHEQLGIPVLHPEGGRLTGLGLSERRLRQLLRLITLDGEPEPLRVARLIARRLRESGILKSRPQEQQ